MSSSDTEDTESSKRENESHIWVSNQDKESAKTLFPQKSFNEIFHIFISEYPNYQKMKSELDRFKSSEPSLKEITTNYDGYCSKCSSLIRAGSRDVMWGKDVEGNTILICLDCQVNAESDKTIVRRLLRKKELDRDIKALRNERDRLASDLHEAEVLDSLKDFLCKEAREGKTLEKDKLYHLIKMLTDLIDLNKGKIIKPIKTSYNGANPEKPMIECKNCKRKFIPLNRNQKYCSTECYNEDRQSYRGNPQISGLKERPIGYDPFREPFSG